MKILIFLTINSFIAAAALADAKVPTTQPINQSITEYEQARTAALDVFLASMIDANRKMESAFRVALKEAMQTEDLAKANRFSREANDLAKVTSKMVMQRQGLQISTIPTGDRVVFVLDGTGMMLSVMADAKDQIVEAVKNLRPTQSFNILVASDDSSEPVKMAFQKTSLLEGTDLNKKLAFRFLENIAAEGAWEMRPAIKAASLLKPDTVFFFENANNGHDPEAIANALDRCEYKEFKFNVISMYQGDDEGSSNQLGKIAKTHRGRIVRYRVSD